MPACQFVIQQIGDALHRDLVRVPFDGPVLETRDVRVVQTNGQDVFLHISKAAFLHLSSFGLCP
jgi:hypothetical protein